MHTPFVQPKIDSIQAKLDMLEDDNLKNCTKQDNGKYHNKINFSVVIILHYYNDITKDPSGSWIFIFR